MARRSKILGKTILLILLLVILIIFGFIWFNYLGVINAKPIFSKFFGIFGLKEQTSKAPSSPKNMNLEDLDNDRWVKLMDSYDIRVEELDKRESDVQVAEQNNIRIAGELQDKELALEEQEKTLQNAQKKIDDRLENIEAIVRNLEGMQPVKAVQILLGMDDQDIIDVLRKADANHRAQGDASMVAYWLSLMPAERAAEISRKMANKPQNLDE